MTVAPVALVTSVAMKCFESLIRDWICTSLNRHHGSITGPRTATTGRQRTSSHAYHTPAYRLQLGVQCHYIILDFLAVSTQTVRAAGHNSWSARSPDNGMSNLEEMENLASWR